MGQKDLTAKKLEDYNDVFADIYNNLLFRGHVLDEDLLSRGATESIYKAADGENAEQRRDTLKNYCNKTRFIIAAFGIENQSARDNIMPIRIMGYDYAAYHAQTINKEELKNGLYPVITIVLNFSDKRWGNAKSLHDILTIPDEFREYVQDYKIYVFDIAFLEDEVIESFTSDFKVIAKFFKNKRLDIDPFTDDKTEIKYPAEVVEFFTVFTGDKRYADAEEYVTEHKKRGEAVTMCTVAQKLEERGRKEGIHEESRRLTFKMLRRGDNDEAIIDFLEITPAELSQFKNEYHAST